MATITSGRSAAPPVPIKTMQADRVTYKIGDLVYHRTDDEPGVVTGILYTATGVEFRVAWQGRCTEFHADIELTHERPFFTSHGKDETV
jgi:hypothetical protein